MQLAARADGTNPDSSLRTKSGYRLPTHLAAARRGAVPRVDAAGELYALRKESAGAARRGSAGTQHTTNWAGVGSPGRATITLKIRSPCHHTAGDPLAHFVAERVGGARAQYTWAKTAGLDATNQFALQAVWAIGPHKHETY